MSGERKKILVINDAPDFVLGTKRMLESGGYDVVEAYSGNAGIEKAHTEKPDLMLVDYTTATWEFTRFLFDSTMEPPEEDVSVIDKLREDESTKNIPMLIISEMDITGSSTPYGGEEWVSPDNILLKPIGKQTLFSNINRLLEAA